VHPAALLTCGGKLFAERSPEAEGAVADGEVRRVVHAAALEVTQHRRPGLLALAVAVPDGEQLLVAVVRCAHQDQDAGAILVEPDVEVDPVRPEVHVALAAQVTLGPRLVLLLPALLQPDDVRWTEPGRVGAKDGGECFFEVAGRDALEVKNGDQRIDARHAAQERREDLARELSLARLVAYPRLRDGQRTDARQHLALGQVAVAHDLAPPGRVDRAGVLPKPFLDFRLHRGLQHATSALSDELVEHAA
jgi:hypothetical protein